MTTSQMHPTRPLLAFQPVRSSVGTTTSSTGIPALDNARIAFVAAVAAVPPITVLHLSATGPMEPAGWTISDYVVTVPYGIPLYAMTAGAMAIGGAALARSLMAQAATRALRVLLTVWAAAVLATAMFPTNSPGTPENASSVVHLIAGAVVFVALPPAGLLLVRAQRRAGRTLLTLPLAVMSVIGTVLSTALIANRLPAVIGMPELMLPPGILQRSAGAVQILLLALAAIVILRPRRQAS